MCFMKKLYDGPEPTPNVESEPWPSPEPEPKPVVPKLPAGKYVTHLYDCPLNIYVIPEKGQPEPPQKAFLACVHKYIEEKRYSCYKKYLGRKIDEQYCKYLFGLN